MMIKDLCNNSNNKENVDEISIFEEDDRYIEKHPYIEIKNEISHL